MSVQYPGILSTAWLVSPFPGNVYRKWLLEILAWHSLRIKSSECVMCLKFRIMILIRIIISLVNYYCRIFQKHHAYTVVIISHYKRRGYVIIPKPYFSGRIGINSRCRRFDLLLFAFLAQYVTAMTTVVAVQVVAIPTGHWRSTVTTVTAPFRQVAGSFN